MAHITMAANDDVHDLVRSDSVIVKRRKLKRSSSAAFGAAAAAGPARVPRGPSLSRTDVAKIVKRVVADEHEEKWFNVSYATSASTSVTLQNLTVGIANGTEHYQRSGAKIKITGIRFSGRIDAANASNIVRFGFFTWDQASNDPPNAAEIDTYDSNLWTTGYISTYALVQDKMTKGETGRYELVKWINGPHAYIVQARAQANVADYTVSATRHETELFSGRIKTQRTATYNTADVQVGGNIYLAYWSDSSLVNHPPFNIDIRIYYHDV